jgi:N-acyl-D-amino-acid deacylase
MHRVVLLLCTCALAATDLAASTLIRGAAVIDGTGTAARVTDVRIAGERIVAIGALASSPDDRIVDGRGLVLAPGFIDTHSHHDRGIFEGRDVLAAVSQGITTIVVGQDGSSPSIPLAIFLSRLETQPNAVNLASYSGHGTLRRNVMGGDYLRPATEDEIERMRTLLRADMAAGALGLSTGLEYDPGLYSAPAEVLELAKVAGAAGGRYISHIRSEDRDFWEAIEEVLEIGRIARMPVQISHMKLGMRALWGQGDRLIARLDRARREGIQVTADVYPYTMWYTSLTALYPKRDFGNRAETEFILKGIAGPDDLLVGNFKPNPAYSGKTIGEIAVLRNTDPASALMAVMALIVENDVSFPDESVVATGMDQRDVDRLYQWPYTNVCSDGSGDGAHPRGFGAFPRMLGHYVRERRVLGLEEAVRRMTSLAAANVGFVDRGVIRKGAFADLVLFGATKVRDRSTLREPHVQAEGIETVWVNGEVVYAAGKTTGSFPGRVLRRVD